MKHNLSKEQIILHQFSKDFLVSDDDEPQNKYQERERTLDFDEIVFPKVPKVSEDFLLFRKMIKSREN